MRFHTTVTERSTFRTCRRQWYYGTIERLGARGQVTWYLIFGSCIHAALEAYYTDNKRNLVDALDAFDAAWKEEDNLLAKDFGDLYGLGIQDEWIGHGERGRLMLEYYDKFDRQAEFQWDEVIAINVEDRAFVDILTKDGEHRDELPLLSGQLDLVVECGKKAPAPGIWIVDHKALISPAYSRALDIDDQVTGYCYLWWRISGDVPRGAVYNVLVKDPPHLPRVLKNGTLSLAKDQRTTSDLYESALKEMYGKEIPADYDEIRQVLREKGWNQFFFRDQLTRNLDELYSFEERLAYEYEDMIHALQDPGRLYPNPNQRTCMGCSHLGLCQAMEERSDIDYIIESMYQVNPPRTTIPAEVLSPEWKGV